jgi:predicted ATP-dependent serine protease
VSETTVEKTILSGFVCAACGTRYAERIQFCIRCFRTGVCIPDYRRVTGELLPAARRTTARKLAAEDQAVFSLKTYPEIKMQHDSFIAIHGGQGGGKTTLTLRTLDELHPSLFVSGEMKVGPVLSAYLRRLEIRRDDLNIIEPQSTNQILDAARDGVRAVGIDSLSVLTLLPEDCVSLARNARVIVIGILQETKAGIAAGSNAWLHAADIVIRCENLKWILEKSRYQELGVSGDILCA